MMTKGPAHFQGLPGTSFVIGESIPDPPFEIAPTNPSVRSITGVLPFSEVLRRVPKIRELRRPVQVRRLTTLAERRHTEFLSRISAGADGPPLVSPATTELAEHLFEVIRRQTGSRVPAASVGEGGSILYTWDSGDHHLEAEIGEGQAVEWMYAHRQTGETWFATQQDVSQLPAEVAERFRLIV